MIASLRTVAFATVLSLLGTPAPGFADGVPVDVIPPPLAASSGTLYSVDQVTGNLVKIDPNTAAVGVVGPTGFLEISGLTYHAPTDRLFGIDGDQENLVSINRYTGSASVVGPLGIQQLHSLSYSEQDSTLLSIDTVGGNLMAIDPETGSVATLSPFAFPNTGGLTDDPTTGVDYGYDFGSGQLFVADLGGGVVESIDDSLPALHGLAFDGSTDRLFAMSPRGGPDQLLRIHPETGVGIEIGRLGNVSARSLALIPAGVPEPSGVALAFVSVLAGSVQRRSRS